MPILTTTEALFLASLIEDKFPGVAAALRSAVRRADTNTSSEATIAIKVKS